MRCYIYLFRHGTTSDNYEGIFSGWRNVSLNKKGFRDAKIISLRLKNKNFGIAFQSDLLRSKQTLNEVLKFHKNVKVITDNRLKERSYGVLQGKTHLSVVEKYGFKKYDEIHRSYDKKAKNGESLKDVEKRVNVFIKDLIETIKITKENVVISCHGNSMRVLRKYFEKLSVKEMVSLYNDFEKVYEYYLEV